jgi:hypothetical protein
MVGMKSPKLDVVSFGATDAPVFSPALEGDSFAGETQKR